MTKKTALLFAIAVIFRIPGINRPIIFDEPKALECLAGPFSAIIDKLTLSSQPPLYYYLLKLWSLCSTDPVFLRFLTVLLGASICVILYKTVKAVWTEEAALYAFIFAVLSPQLTFQAQYLRPYCLATFLSAILVYYFIKFKADGGKGMPRLVYFGIFTAATALCLYTFYYSIFLIFALNIGALYFFRKDKEQLFLWLASQVTAALLYLFWLPYLLMQNFMISQGTTCHLVEIENARIGFYIGKVHVGNAMRTVLAYFHLDDVLGQAMRYSEYIKYKWFFLSAAAAFMVPVIFCIIRAVRTMLRTERVKGASVLFLLLIVVPALTVIIFSIGGDFDLWCRALVNMKYFTQSSLYVLVLVSLFLIGIKKGPLKKTLFACVAVFFLFLDMNIYQFPSNIYKPAISYLSDKTRDCKLIVLGPPSALDFFNTLEDKRFADYRILKYGEDRYSTELERGLAGADKFYFYYLKSAENMVFFPDLDSKFVQWAGGRGFAKRDEKKVNDVLIISYFERRK